MVGILYYYIQIEKTRQLVNGILLCVGSETIGKACGMSKATDGN
jgi:hypothetical protein